MRIHQECDGWIAKFRPKDHRLVSEGLSSDDNGDLEGQIFIFHVHTNNGFFFLLTIEFYFKITFQKSLNRLKCNMT